MKHKLLKAILEKRVKLTPTVILVSLSLKRPIRFTAGQHIIVHIPTSDGTVERPFSIASPPSQNKKIELIIKLIPGGLASTFFENKKNGSEINLSGPKGTFKFFKHKNPVHFIASSTGIAPLRSILHQNLDNRLSHRLHLTLGSPSAEEMILESELDGLSKKHHNFSYSAILTTNPLEYPDVYVKNIDHRQKNDFYLCGSPNFVEDIKKALLKRGVDSNSIHYEEFK